jgi:branched-chain amino acid transport system permease protein
MSRDERDISSDVLGDDEEDRSFGELFRAYLIPRGGISIGTGTRWQNVLLGAFVAWLLILPFVSNRFIIQIGIFFFIYGVMTVSWDLVAGYQGTFSFAHAAFFGIGAYTTALATIHLGISPWLGILLSVPSTFLFAIPISYPAIRLSGPYTAMVTLAYSEILRRIVVNWASLTNGPVGLTGVPDLFPTLPGAAGDVAQYYSAMLLFAVLGGAVYLTLRSRFGLVIQAIRDSNDAARGLGINVVRYKLAGFLFGSTLAGIAGAFYAHYVGFISPKSMDLEIMIQFAAMVFVGGVGTFFGPIIGTGVLLGTGEFLREFGAWRLFMWGALILIFVLFSPGGLIEILDRVRERLGLTETRTLEKEKQEEEETNE